MRFWGLGSHLALRQLQRPGLAAGIGPELQWGKKWKSKEQEGTQVASISKCEYLWGKNPVKSAGAALTCVFQWWKLLGLSSELVPVNYSHFCCMDHIGSACFSSLFLLVAIHLSFACLMVGWKWSRFFVWYPERLGNLGSHPTLPFPMMGAQNSSAGKFLCGQPGPP